ncbi:unnamed protein product [Didymodactylos carnosus]|nr:unnamed protein product [Didymodactylos carnosus]CAF4004617.1 unnamed protein product [Didymodactylos carnosus]
MMACQASPIQLRFPLYYYRIILNRPLTLDLLELRFFNEKLYLKMEQAQTDGNLTAVRQLLYNHYIEPVEKQLTQIRMGINDVIPSEWFESFSDEEVEKLLTGYSFAANSQSFRDLAVLVARQKEEEEIKHQWVQNYFNDKAKSEKRNDPADSPLVPMAPIVRESKSLNNAVIQFSIDNDCKRPVIKNRKKWHSKPVVIAQQKRLDLQRQCSLQIHLNDTLPPITTAIRKSLRTAAHHFAESQVPSLPKIKAVDSTQAKT